MKCTNCGSEYAYDTLKFCPHCGTKVQLLAAPQAASGSTQQAAPKHFAKTAPIVENQPEPVRSRTVIDGVSQEVWGSAYRTFAQAQVAADHVSKAENLCAEARSDLEEEKSVLNRMTGWGIAIILLFAVFAAGADISIGFNGLIGILVFFFPIGPGMVGFRKWALRHGWDFVYSYAFLFLFWEVLIPIALITGWFFYVGQFRRVKKAKQGVEEADQLLNRMMAEVC